jgi:ADP-ribosylglycohydrolase
VTAHPYYTKTVNGARDASDAAAGALLGTFVGDALGMRFEGQPAAAIPTQLEMEEARLGRGTYTDDTQMMIALGESLLELDRIDEEHLACPARRTSRSAAPARRCHSPRARRSISAVAHAVAEWRWRRQEQRRVLCHDVRAGRVCECDALADESSRADGVGGGE